jgi:hypothetical protein
MRLQMPSPRLLRPLLGAALAAGLGVGCGTVVLDGFSATTAIRVLQALAVFGTGLALIAGTASLLIVRLGGWRQGEEEFERVVRRTERLADEPDEDGWQECWLEPEDDDVVADAHAFGTALRATIGGLPPEFHLVLEHVEVVVADSQDPLAQRIRRGVSRPARYSAHESQGPAGEAFSERIVILRDLLIRDFGHDPEQLRQRLDRILRRELGRGLRRAPGLRG